METGLSLRARSKFLGSITFLRLSDSAQTQRDLGDEAGSGPGGPPMARRAGPETLYLSSVKIAELMFGLSSSPKGKRKGKLAAACEGVLELLAAGGRSLTLS